MTYRDTERPADGRKMKYLTQEELARFFRAVQGERDMAMFQVTYWRGLRASELGTIVLDDLDRSKPVWKLRIARLKGSFGGEYNLSRQERRSLQAWLKLRGRDPGPLFPSREGSGIKRGMVFHLFQKYAQAAGLPPDKQHPHVLKHSIATHLLDKDLGITDVQDWLGHRSLTNTIRYAVITNARRRKAEAKAYA